MPVIALGIDLSACVRDAVPVESDAAEIQLWAALPKCVCSIRGHYEFWDCSRDPEILFIIKYVQQI